MFRAECSAGNDVIMVDSALYGRMLSAKCHQNNYGHVGCSGDVLSVAESRCAARRRCEIEVPNGDMTKMSNCPKDFIGHLAIEHSCMPGE